MTVNCNLCGILETFQDGFQDRWCPVDQKTSWPHLVDIDLHSKRTCCRFCFLRNWLARNIFIHLSCPEAQLSRLRWKWKTYRAHYVTREALGLYLFQANENWVNWISEPIQWPFRKMRSQCRILRSQKVNALLGNKNEGLSPVVVLKMPLVLFVVIRQSLFQIADDNRRKRRL